MAQDGLAAFEPAFVDELAVILRLRASTTCSATATGEPSERNWLRDETGGSVYLRLSTRPIEQPQARDDDRSASSASSTAPIGCASPARTAQVVIAYTGAVAPEAIEAVGLMAEDRRDVGLLAVTSADRLNAGWTAAQRARERGLVHARSHIERLLADVPAALRHRHRARRPSGDAGLARRGARPSRARARRRAFRPDRHRSPISTAITASTPTPSSRRRNQSRRAGRSVTSRRCHSLIDHPNRTSDETLPCTTARMIVITSAQMTTAAA